MIAFVNKPIGKVVAGVVFLGFIVGLALVAPLLTITQGFPASSA